jgi:hypothetical protein
MTLGLTGAPLLLALFVYAVTLYASSGLVTGSGKYGKGIATVCAYLGLTVGVLVLLFSLWRAVHGVT